LCTGCPCAPAACGHTVQVIPDTPDPSAAPAAAGAGDLRTHAEQVLRALVGTEDATLRPDQWAAIEALVAGRARVLVVQRTGWGKSAVYFVATALLRRAGAGPTVIVSPLLSLMRNQVDAARRAGIRAETINSANVTEWDGIRARVRAGEVDVLLVSPERLNNPDFRDQVLPSLTAEAGLIVVDEAHCISDWGHDFRPDYRRIATMLTALPAGTPVLATTATANARVTADVAEQLETGSHVGDVLVLRGTLDRTSLHLAVRPRADHAGQVAWLTANLPALTGSGIVYCLTVAAAEGVAEQLRAAGISVRAYTGQTDPAERLECEQDLLANEVKALVATSALGMGFDKPDLGFVVHVGAPPSPVAYYQQVGRAGRATPRADVFLLPGTDDRAVWDWFADQSFPDRRAVDAVLGALAEADAPLSLPALEPRVDLRRSRLEMMLKVLDVDGAVARTRGGWTATGAAWTYDADRYARVAATRAAERDAVITYEKMTGCRMAFLRAALDDPDLAADPGWVCGRCDNCGGTFPDVLPDAAAVVAAAERIRTPGVELAARRVWPTGMATLGVPVTGRVAEDERAETGRAVTRLDGLGLGQVLRALFAQADTPDSRPDGGLPVALRAPALAVLDAWAPQVDGVVSVASATHPRLVEQLAAGVARHLGVPVVGTVRPRPGRGPGRHDVNSAQRLAGVWDRLVLDLAPAAAAGLPGRSVLLVDDRCGTGWTVTVAARLLREAGASAVHPFTLASG